MRHVGLHGWAVAGLRAYWLLTGPRSAAARAREPVRPARREQIATTRGLVGEAPPELQDAAREVGRGTPPTYEPARTEPTGYAGDAVSAGARLHEAQNSAGSRGGSRPRCSYARRVAARPRGVRCSRPRCRR